MARVQSTLVLNDRMSKVLGHINKAMGLTLNSLEAVQRASGKSFNTANFAAARREMGAADAALNEMEQSYKDCNNQQQQLNRRISQGTSAAGGLLGKIKGIASAYLGMKAVTGAVGLSDTITQTDARLSMMNDGRQNIAELNNMIYASAQRSRGAYLTTADAVAKLGLMAGDAFSSNKETIAFVEQINKQFKIAGTSAAGIDAAMLQLTQAMGSGVLRGEEYNSILEQAPNIIQAIAKYMNVPKGQLKEMAADGKITAGIIKAAMFACADETNTKFESMPKTWSDIWTSMKNKAVKALDPVLKKINQLANSERVQRTVNGLLKAFSTMALVLAQIFDGACAVYDFVANNWSWLSPIITGIVGALLLYKGTVFAITAIETAAAAAKGVHAAATALLTGKTFAATVAQYGLNTAMLACPITWIIALIMVLIVLVAIFFEQIHGAAYWVGALFENIALRIANGAIAAWSVIKNIGLRIANNALAAWAVIKNIGFWFANRLNAVWNVFNATCSNIGIAFNNTWADVQTSFWNTVNVIMQGLKTLAEKANACLGWMGVNIDTSGLDFASKKIDEINSKKESYVSTSDAWNEGLNTFAYADVAGAFNTHKIDFVGDYFKGLGTFDTFKDGWSADAYNAGAEYGRKVKGIYKGVFDDVMGALGVGNDPTNDDRYKDILNQIAENTGNTADNTGKSNEELSYLRDIAERDAINRFTTAEIHVDLGGVTNNVSTNADLDGIISYLTDGVAEALATASEGVY